MTGATCPQCGGGDMSTGTVSDGSVQTVCLVCGWDTEHGVTTKPCPGACGRWISDDLLCCDQCWARIPTRVPGFERPWRTARNYARRMCGSDYDWRQFERATDAARTWLVAHPSKAVVSDVT